MRGQLGLRLAASLACAVAGAMAFVFSMRVAVMAGLSGMQNVPFVIISVASFVVPLVGARWVSAIPVVGALGPPIGFAFGYVPDMGAPGATFGNLVVMATVVFGIAWAGGRVGLTWKRWVVRKCTGKRR